MEAAPPGRRARRRSRNPGATPHTHLVRLGFLVTAPAVVALLFAVSTPGTLARPPLEPLFDGEAAAEIATALSTEHPARVPGTIEAESAALWYHETVAAIGLATEDDVWEADLADLGRVRLQNVVTVVPGRSDETVVVLAHRDNAGAELPSEDNATGTAALIELLRGFAPQAVGPDPEPQRTLVFVSTDAGVYGGAGAKRFAEMSPHARRAVAAVVLDGIGTPGRPALHIAGDDPVTSARALVGTATARVEEQVGVAPLLPDVATQLTSLATPLAAAEQGRLLASEVAAITLSTKSHHEADAVVTPGARVFTPERLDVVGSAAEELVDSLESSVGAPFATTDSIYFQGRAVSGWAVRLTLVLLVVPFALGLVDLLARARRQRLRLRPAARGLRTRLLLLFFGAALVGVGTLTGVFPTGDPLPLPTFSPYVSDPSVAGLGVLGIAFVIGWLGGRRRLVPTGQVSAEDRLAGLVTALVLLAAVAVALTVVKPYALVFVLPSLYAWLFIQTEGPFWRRVVLYLIGLAGPLVGLVLLGKELALGVLETPLYVLGLATVGYVSSGTVLLALAWAAAAAQVGAVAFGRYGPYARGAEPPPPGAARRALARAARTRPAQSSTR